MVQGAELVFFVGQLDVGMEGVEDELHGLGGGEGSFADTFEIEIDLRVVEVGGEIGGQFECEGGLADTSLALESRDVNASNQDRCPKFLQILLASSEVRRRRGELMERRQDGSGSRN